MSDAVDEREMAAALEHESGIAGLAGEADMRIVLERAGAEQAAAVLAVDVYVHRLCAGIAAIAAALGGIDALVFTGGVGEKAAAIRGRATGSLAFLGVGIDARGNDHVGGDAEITAPGAGVRTLILRAREDLEMARQTREALSR
jgi:acetate kinase